MQLGPVDPILGQYPVSLLLKAIKSKPVAEIDDQILILADQGEKALIQMRQTVKNLLQERVSMEKVDELAQLLSQGTWTHDYAIDVEEATRLGLTVKTDIPDVVLQLMVFFSQPVQYQPGVKYLPVRRRLHGSEIR